VISLAAKCLGNLDFLGSLLEGGLERLGDVLGCLGGDGLEVLDLLDGRLDALAKEGGLQLDDFRQRLGADQGFEMRESGFGIGAQRGNGLERQVAGTVLRFRRTTPEPSGSSAPSSAWHRLPSIAQRPFRRKRNLVGGLGCIEARNSMFSIVSVFVQTCSILFQCSGFDAVSFTNDGNRQVFVHCNIFVVVHHTSPRR
jgi:hypothetical protein